MMRIGKRRLSFVMAALLLCSTNGMATLADTFQQSRSAETVAVAAVDTLQDGRYFYWQLNDDQKRIYDAFYYMYDTGMFKRMESFDMTEGGYVSQSLLKAYAAGDYTVMDYFGKAKDAFQYDYPDCFYVDWSYLTLRVTQDTSGMLHGYLGAGRSDTYLLPGFTPDNTDAAVQAYEKAVGAIVAEAQKVTPTGMDTLREAQVYWVNDYITRHMIYRFEYEATAGNARTSYDALIYGEGVCEAYTRAFQVIMARLGIPCIAVYGGYQVSTSQIEQHVWNYVQLEDGLWYGVDVTHDDPSFKNISDKNSGYETREFCLVGRNELNARHFPSGQLSGANYDVDFVYPELAMEAPREKEIYTDGDLIVKLVEDYYSEDTPEILESGTILVSYRGKNYTQNAAEGYYILCKFSQYYPGTDTWSEMDWGYITPELYSVAGGMEPEEADPEMGGNYVRFPLPHVMKAQFAVTTTPPSFRLTEDGGFTGSLYYEGNPNLLTCVSEIIENKWGTYVAPPYPTKATPYFSGQLECGVTYHVSITYNDKLIPDGSGADPSVSFSSSTADEDNASADRYTRIENFKFDGESTVEFDFTPSGQFADHWTTYLFQINGLLGNKSGKRPVAFSYGAGFRTTFCSLGVNGYNWSLMGRPQLLDSSDIDTSGWEAVDIETGLPINVDLSAITNRLVLKTMEPTPKEASNMEDVLSKATGEKFLTKALYNISFSACKACIVQTGQGVRVCIGYPAGYSYEDFTEGEVAFKAYHYKVDPITNQLTGEVEEISCVAVPQGLIVVCKSFSPFAIVAAQADAETVIMKNIIVSVDGNGQIYDGETLLEGANAIISIAPGETKVLTVKANDNYDIDAILLDGIRQKVNDINEMTVSLSYDDIGASAVLNASFVTAAIHAEEKERGETHIFTIEDTADDPQGSETSSAEENEQGSSSVEESESGISSTEQNGTEGSSTEGSGSEGPSAETNESGVSSTEQKESEAASNEENESSMEGYVDDNSSATNEADASSTGDRNGIFTWEVILLGSALVAAAVSVFVIGKKRREKQ